MNPKTYIGNGVYLEVSGNEIIVTTEDVMQVTNRIVFDFSLWQELTDYVDTVRRHAVRVEAHRPRFIEKTPPIENTPMPSVDVPTPSDPLPFDPNLGSLPDSTNPPDFGGGSSGGGGADGSW